jgi:uncharacterized protein (DUF4415 family)
MARKERIVRASGEEIARRLARGEDRTDWKRVKAMSQAEVERLADEEEGPPPKGWEKNIVLGIPTPKKDIHIRLDADIVDWFKSRGKGYQTRINAVLRAFVQSR